MSIGAHIHAADVLAGALERKAEVVQFFLGDPQSWKTPNPHPQADALADAGITVYVHSPYPVNIAATNNRIRIPSRKTVMQNAEAAAKTGAKGLIVHGGHVTAKEDPALGLVNWRKFFERQTAEGGFPLPILIENTAGGENACARRLDTVARLWEAIGDHEVGFCLDTCHAHAGGEELLGIVDRVKAITGRIDLIHANDSRDPFDSRRDRHANIGAGAIDPDLIVAVIRSSGAPALVETPAAGQAADIAYLRERIGS
jgi:deoxyribonuclease-4